MIDFYNRFKTEEDCILFFEKMRWNGHIVSPFTGGEVYKFNTRFLYKCKDTAKQFSVRTGTIFEESRLPLQKWFLAIYIINSLKKSISSIQLSKYLGVTQKTAWFMLQRIRYAVEHEAFKKPLSGTVEIDETYMGDKKRGKRGSIIAVAV